MIHSEFGWNYFAGLKVEVYAETLVVDGTAF